MRIDADEIELGDDYIWRWNDEPFTGTTEQRTVDGAVLHENEYRNGVQDGLARTYWPDGTVRAEFWYDYGIQIRERHWDQSARLRKDTVTDSRGLVKQFSYAEDGSVTDSYVRGLDT